MSPEDQRVWEEDAETEYAEAHARALPATLSPTDAEKVSQDVGEVERARVARYAGMLRQWHREVENFERETARAESAEAEVERLRVRLAKVEALSRQGLADDGRNAGWDALHEILAVVAPGRPEWTPERIEVLRAALADASTEQTKGGE